MLRLCKRVGNLNGKCCTLIEEAYNTILRYLCGFVYIMLEETGEQLGKFFGIFYILYVCLVT